MANSLEVYYNLLQIWIPSLKIKIFQKENDKSIKKNIIKNYNGNNEIMREKNSFQYKNKIIKSSELISIPLAMLIYKKINEGTRTIQQLYAFTW